MSVFYCNNCDRFVDTDYEAGHYKRCGKYCTCEDPKPETLDVGDEDHIKWVKFCKKCIKLIKEDK